MAGELGRLGCREVELLADEDEKIVHTISGKLIDIGSSAVPLLQEAEIEQPEMAERIADTFWQHYRLQNHASLQTIPVPAPR